MSQDSPWISQTGNAIPFTADPSKAMDILLSSLLPQSGTRLLIASPGDHIADGVQADAVIADHVLQHARDYRTAIRKWFAAVAHGGHLVIVVPHAFLFDRMLSIPSPWDANAERIYTPKLLAEEIEEALVPNSYRLRHLGDDDSGYDYEADAAMPPAGGRVIGVLQKIELPGWVPGEGPPVEARSPEPDFFVARTRVETAVDAAYARILLMKLDHLGDFIMAIPAIERVRSLFPEAEITLVVGSWNIEMAAELALVDHVIAFDAFPRNAGEETADVRGQKALFEQTVKGRYDLAIDLRTDPDTRFLLASIDADIRAGLGLQSEFPFLDIFLPVDFTRRGHESSLEEVLDHHRFPSDPGCARNDYRIAFSDTRRPAQRILVWGPYLNLRAGTYIIEPRLEIATLPRKGLLSIEVTLDDHVAAHAAITGENVPNLCFTVDRDGTRFEMRIRSDRRHPAPAFNFYGARLLRQGSGDLLHQSDYLLLLTELVRLRTRKHGRLAEANAEPAT